MKTDESGRTEMTVTSRCCGHLYRTSVLFMLSLALMTPVLAEQQAPAPSSEPEQLTVAGNVAYFTADDGVHGRELWKSDGNPEGTQLVKDLEPGPGGADFRIGPGGVVGSAFLFVARTRQQEWALYRTDGTDGGTQLISALSPGPVGAAVPLAVMRDRLYLNVLNTDRTFSLWVSDGTHTGTHPLDLHVPPTIFTSWATRSTSTALREVFHCKFAGQPATWPATL